MLMVHDKLRVGLLTDHIPVNEVSTHLTEELLVKKVDTIRPVRDDRFIMKK